MRIEEIFRFPNANGQSFSSTLYELSEDALNFGKYAIEKCYAKDFPTLLMELWSRAADTFIPKKNVHGVITGYTQKVGENDPVNFKKHQVSMLQYNSRSRNHLGKPMLEGLESSVNIIIKAMDFIVRTFDYNEIPPGILWMKGATQEQISTIKAAMKEKREGGNIEFFMTMIGGHFELIEWIDIKHSLKDLDMISHVSEAERRIYNRCGVTSVDENDIKDVNRATSRVMEGIRNSKLIKPLTQLIEDSLNLTIVWSDLSDQWKIELEPQSERTRIQINEENKTLIPLGIKTVNRGRKDLGYDPVPGGDEPIMVVGGSKVLRIRDLPSGELNPQLSGLNPDKDKDEKEEDFNESDHSDKAIKVLKYIYSNAIRTIDVKKALTDEKRLLKAYEKIWSEKREVFVKKIANVYLKGGNVKSEISHIINHFHKKMGNEAKPVLKKSFDIGLRKTLKDDPELEVTSKISDSVFKSEMDEHLKVIDSVLLDNSKPESRSFKNTMKKAIKRFEETVTKAENDRDAEKAALLASLFGAYDTITKRLDDYAAQTWAFQHHGYYGVLKEASDANMENLDWVNVSDNICVDCVKLADDSPYSANTLPTVPRAGKTACGTKCFCFVRKN